MDVYRIQDYQVDGAGRQKGTQIRQLAASFAGDNGIEVLQEHGRVRVRLSADHTSVILDAAGPGCEFERAVNLLRLHMPDTREKPE